ncbi:copper chaperone PCu(A)C [Henriciella barbarensis]|uniref:Copper chaperone PCu(A)C n=1 Tax=Henriciella barbarensis TaxID=86342 RepID=A0A399QYY9_9PROT|nr:copper chaperone PCu(A)C [Henriciella barbarensis]RIJ24346.1 copper chaperone PCu(A)C [Henriciella barbarensis]
MKRLSALLIAPAFIAACGGPAETDGPVLSYEDAFIMAPIAGRDVTMGGIEIAVEGGSVTLTGAISDIAGTVEMHTMEMNDGTMQMRPVETFEIADGETLTLERGGSHLMFFGLVEDLSAGETANISFSFETETGETITLEAEAELRAQGE